MAAAGTLSPVASSATPAAPTPDANPTACANRVNNTPEKLINCVNKDDLWAHMVKFQQIADANPGADGHPSRNSGEPGYKASADYVAAVMRAAGYNVTLQEYKFPYFSFVGIPVFQEDSPTPQSLRARHGLQPRTSRWYDHAALQPAGGIVVPATPTPSSASGCAASDFARVHLPGNIALIQRGTLHLRPEGGQRRGRPRCGGRHLQRGQPRTYQSVQREPRWHRAHPRRLHDPYDWAPSSTAQAQPGHGRR